MARRRAIFPKSASEDLGRLEEDDPTLVPAALRLIRQLERGEIDGIALTEMAATGDLSDCFKVYFGGSANNSHRIVYRQIDDEDAIEIIEIVAVEARAEMYAYLLAAVRLGRLPIESKPRFDWTHEAAIARRGRQRKASKEKG